MIIVEMKKHFQLRALEWWSSATLASWGLMALAIPDMFKDNPACAIFLDFAPQHVWGIATFTIGMLRLAALLVNGMWHRTPMFRWVGAMLSTFVWFSISVTFIKSSIPNVGLAIYLWAMFADMYSAYRSATDFIEAAAQAHLKKLTVAELPPHKRGDNVRSLAPRVG